MSAHNLQYRMLCVSTVVWCLYMINLAIAFRLRHSCSAQHPVKASTAQVAVEMASVSKAAMALCPVEIVLERVVVTGTGNVVACWQVAAGSDPSEIRR